MHIYSRIPQDAPRYPPTLKDYRHNTTLILEGSMRCDTRSYLGPPDIWDLPPEDYNVIRC